MWRRKAVGLAKSSFMYYLSIVNAGLLVGISKKPPNNQPKLTMNKRFVVFVLFMFCSIVPFLSCAQSKIDKDVLRWLDAELELVPHYDEQKMARIDSLSNLAAQPGLSSSDLVDRWVDLAIEYSNFVSDSSLAYYDRAYALALNECDSLQRASVRLRRIKTLGIQGYFKEAVQEIEDLEQAGIPEELTSIYLDSGRQLYSYMSAYAHDQPYHDAYYLRQDYYRTEQLRVLDKDSYDYKVYLAEYYYDEGNMQRSKEMLVEILDSLPMSDGLYGRAAANLASIHLDEKAVDESAYYLVMSAISDIRCSVKENTSLQRLSLYLYKRGDLERAYRYLSISLADAVSCGTPLRTLEVSELMPLIDAAYKDQLIGQRKLLTIAVVVVSLLLVVLVLTVAYIFRQMRRLHSAHERLREANRIKEEYIGRFLDLCSIYMDRLDNFGKLVVRKITAGQSEELVKMTKSAKFAEEQNRKFYEDFDAAFLHIYPTFIDEFNSLLRPEERIEIKEPGKLNTGLRIFALMRMGIDDSVKVANFLHYSVNTIYAYRNRMRNKAVDRVNFEDNVLHIASAS